MRKRDYLLFDNEAIPVSSDKDYNVNPVDYDKVNQTEAGTYVRDLINSNLPSVSVSMTVSDFWLEKLYVYKAKRSITVQYYFAGAMYLALMFMQDLSVKRSGDLKAGAVWDVSFNLHYLKDVS